MTTEQFNQATQIRKRVRELKIMKCRIERGGDKITICDFEIPKNSKEVILAMCEKEINDLENRFNSL